MRRTDCNPSLIKTSKLYVANFVMRRKNARNKLDRLCKFWVQEMARRREELFSSLPAEPESIDPQAIRIVVRLPQGERMDRRFLKTDRLKVGL